MWIGKGLIIGIVASLLVGAAVLAVNVESEAGSAHLDDSPFTVPVGRIGDRVTYTTFARTTAAEPWGERIDWGFEVAGLAEAPDSVGRMHDAVVIVRSPDNSTAQLHWVYWDVAVVGVETTKNYKIDLTSRAIISRTYDYQAPGTPSLLGASQRIGANTDYGPTGWGINNAQGPYEKYPGEPNGAWQFSPVMYQGQAIQLGRDVGPLANVVLAQESNSWTLEGTVGLPRFEYSAGVVDRRLVGEYDSYDLRSKGCIEFHSHPGSWTHALGETTANWLGWPVPFDSLVCFQVDTWVSAAVAYPVLTETKIWVDGTQVRERLVTLSAIEVGRTPIPWDAYVPPTYEDGRDRTSPEMSTTDVEHPEEGSDSTLKFGLKEAMRLVDESPLLVRFAAWKAQHPEHFLIGYQLNPREAGILRWSLVYGEPPHSAFVVTVQKVPGQPAQSPREEGEFTVDPIGDDYTNYVTISYVSKVWGHAVRPDGSNEPPNWVRWGYEYLPPRVQCTAPNSCATQDAKIKEWYNGMLLVGHTSAEQSAGPVDRESTFPIQGRYDSYLVAFIPSGFNMVVAGHAQEFGEFKPLTGSDTPPTIATATSAPDATLPALGNAVLVSSSLLAIFLAVYFFPLLKQLGLEAVMAVPGYAKLHKKTLLNNQYRDRITTLVRAEPGITPSELQAAVGGDFTTIVYHLRVLERNKMVSSLVDGRHKRFFPAEHVAWGERGRLAALRNVKTRELYELIHDQPGMAPKDLSRRIGLSRPTVYWHVDRLVRVGLVGHDREAGRARFYASDPTFRAPQRPDNVDVEVA